MTNLLADTEWKVGDRCYALFSEDELWYPATIMKVQGSVFTVEYDVYGNQEERILDELEESDPDAKVIEGDTGNDRYEHYERTRHLFEAPKTKETSKKSKKEAKPVKKSKTSSTAASAAPRMPPMELIPPPPPGADDDLCQLLMSFFVAGYRTGVYTASN